MPAVVPFEGLVAEQLTGLEVACSRVIMAPVQAKCELGLQLVCEDLELKTSDTLFKGLRKCSAAASNLLIA